VLIVVVNGEERLYSQKLACTECGTSVPQLEPRSFSFNSPYGACEECHGLGSIWSPDPAKIIVDASKPLFDGGLGPGGNSWTMQHRLSELTRKHRINLNTPFEKFPAKTRELLREAGATVAKQESPIVAAKFENRDVSALARALKENRVLVAARRGHLRVSPHFYNNETDLLKLAEALRAL